MADRPTDKLPEGDTARPKKTSEGRSPERQRWITTAWIVAALLLFLFLQLNPTSSQREESLSSLIKLVDEKAVTEATISEGAIEGIYRKDGNEVSFVTMLPPNFETAPLVKRAH